MQILNSVDIRFFTVHLFHEQYFDKIMGTASFRKAIEAGKGIEELVAGWADGLAKFAELRKAYLLYWAICPGQSLIAKANAKEVLRLLELRIGIDIDRGARGIKPLG